MAAEVEAVRLCYPEFDHKVAVKPHDMTNILNIQPLLQGVLLTTFKKDNLILIHGKELLFKMSIILCLDQDAG